MEEHPKDNYTDYLFNAKELDEESGFYYYSARYFDPKYINSFISVDPLWDKKPWITPYAYCRNNPLVYIDPDGKDEWEINSQGEIMKRISTEKHDAFFIVDDKGNRMKDKNGNEISQSFKYGTVLQALGQKSMPFSGTTKDGIEVKGSIDFYGIKGNENAEKAFKFLANNTNVEWSNTNFSNNYSILATSHVEGSDYSGGFTMRFASSKGFDITNDMHNHPSNSTDPSPADMRFAGRLNTLYPNATTSIYTKETGKNHYYNESGTISVKPFIFNQKK